MHNGSFPQVIDPRNASGIRRGTAGPVAVTPCHAHSVKPHPPGPRRQNEAIVLSKSRGRSLATKAFVESSLASLGQIGAWGKFFE